MSKAIKGENIIPIKVGGPQEQDQVEAFADLDTQKVEKRSWSKGPSQEFYKINTTRIISAPFTKQGRENYERIFNHS